MFLKLSIIVIALVQKGLSCPLLSVAAKGTAVDRMPGHSVHNNNR